MWGYIKKLLVPYLVFQLLYIAVGSLMIYLNVINYSTDTLLLSVVEPSSPLYFLVCMIFWRMVCPLLELFVGQSLKQFIVLAVVGVLFSIDSRCNTMILPMFYLLPFYGIGFHTNWEVLIEKLKKIKLAGLLCLTFIYFILVMFVPYEIILFRENIWLIEGGALKVLMLKLLYYMIAFLGVMLIIPAKFIKGVTEKSENGMIIYIGSSFLAPYSYIILYNLIPALQESAILNFICIIVFSILLIWFLGLKCWMSFYNFIFSRLVR